MKTFLKTSVYTLTLVGLLGLASPVMAVTGGHESTSGNRTTGNVVIDGKDMGSVAELYDDESLYHGEDVEGRKALLAEERASIKQRDEATAAERAQYWKDVKDSIAQRDAEEATAREKYWADIKAAIADRDAADALARTAYWGSVKETIEARDAENAAAREAYWNTVEATIAERDAMIDQIKAAYADEPAAYMAAQNDLTDRYAADTDLANAAYEAAADAAQAAYASAADSINGQLALELGAIDMMEATGVLRPQDADMMREVAAGVANSQMANSYAEYADAMSLAQSICTAEKDAALNRYYDGMDSLKAAHDAVVAKYHAAVAGVQYDADSRMQSATMNSAIRMAQAESDAQTTMNMAGSELAGATSERQRMYGEQVASAVKTADTAVTAARENYDRNMTEAINNANEQARSMIPQSTATEQ